MDAAPNPENAASAPSVGLAGASAIEAEITAVVESTAKRWWASRTIIFNAVVMALVAAESQVNLLQPLLPVNVYALVAFLLPVANTILRLVTTTPVR
jgi:hypothetical protein